MASLQKVSVTIRLQGYAQMPGAPKPQS